MRTWLDSAACPYRRRVMKNLSRTSAETIRAGATDAMDALDWMLSELGPTLDEEQAQELRLAVGRSMDAINTQLTNPVIRQYPSLGDDWETWGELAIEQATRRIASRKSGESG